MEKRLRILLSQQKPRLGDIESNTEKVINRLNLAKSLGVGLVVYPELFLCGYPPEDLLFRPEMPGKIEAASKIIAANTEDISLVIGTPWYQKEKIYNSALFFSEGKLQQIHHKKILPNYSVFDERRYFSPGTEELTVEVSDFRFMLLICEELWIQGVEERIRNSQVDMLLSINASPFYMGKRQERFDLIKEVSRKAQTAISYVNLGSCQDELVFDGGTFVTDGQGQTAAIARQFVEDIVLCDLTKNEKGLTINGNRKAETLEEEEQLFLALTTSLRTYVDDNGFRGVLLGLSGGIDSAVVLVLACAALGSDRVRAVMLPYTYTSPMSTTYARELAKNCAVDYLEISIDKVVDTFIETLPCDKNSEQWPITLQNIQARSRGQILMALSNYSGDMVLATGNKSEMAVGYATLYGDMVGGFAPLKDVDKTRVYRIAHYCNRDFERIPDGIITREPSAELLPDQKDSDNLPEYPVLDSVLAGYIEKGLSTRELSSFADNQQVLAVMRMVDRNEHKRQQAAIGTKVTELGFGKDRRMPITQFWQHSE